MLERALTQPEGIASDPRDLDWVAKNIPCQESCPAHTDIPGYLGAIYRGEFDEAYRINLRDNVFPAVLGRVCSRPCEETCRHGWDGLGDSLAICFSKRAASDLKSEDIVVFDRLYPETGKKIAIIGAGPAGLACARNLSMMGHTPTVYEKHNKPGGMMNQGIPEFRLPREHIDREIDQVRRQGVEIICNTSIGIDITMRELLDTQDAVVMACGTLRENYLRLPGADLEGIYHGIPWLLEANENDKAPVGDNLLVIGGGFTAMDCSRTAYRLGAKQIRVCYRRSVNEMLITPGELEELEVEGIPMDFMVSPKEYIGENGHIKAMRFIKTELGEPDESGRRRPIEIEGSEFDVPADIILLATGQFPKTDFIDKDLYRKLVGDDEWLLSSPGQKTALEQIFAAGDFSTGAATLIEAIAHGKQCALDVDTYLMGNRRMQEVAYVEDGREFPRTREMDLVDLHDMPTLPLEARDLTNEVEQGYEESAAKEESARCYLCYYKYEIDNSRCIQCDQCIVVKPRPDCIVRTPSLELDPDGRIVEFGNNKGTDSYNDEYFINQNDCIRCNACLEVCPTGCISVQKVSRCVTKSDATEPIPV